MTPLKKPGTPTPISESPSFESSVQEGKVNSYLSQKQDVLRIINEHFCDTNSLPVFPIPKE